MTQQQLAVLEEAVAAGEYRSEPPHLPEAFDLADAGFLTATDVPNSFLPCSFAPTEKARLVVAAAIPPTEW